jgi:hypothetical protein
MAPVVLQPCKLGQYAHGELERYAHWKVAQDWLKLTGDGPGALWVEDPFLTTTRWK